MLINCAGYVHHGSILDCSEKDWDFSFDLNVKSMYRTCRAFLPGMLKAGKGSIVNIASAVSSIKAVPNRFVYGSTKAAVIGLTKLSLPTSFAAGSGAMRSALERCSRLRWSSGSPRKANLNPKLKKFARSSWRGSRWGRLGRPEEIAALAVYLASDESSFTTGQTHLIDGGLSL